MGSLENFQKFLPIFEKRYTFEVCPRSRVEELVQFIDTYWKKDHIFVKSRELLDWNLYDAQRERYNFCLATEKATGEIHAMVGFTYTSHFDPAIETPISWGCLWKAREDVADPGAGLMVEWMKDIQFPSCAVVGLGESAKAIRLAKKNGAHTGVLDQYYLANDDVRQFRLLGGQWVRREKPSPGPARTLREMGEEDFMHLAADVKGEIPCFKSPLYYVNRYLRHPIYRYHASMILDGQGSQKGVIIWRESPANGSNCLRIADFFGVPGALNGCRPALQRLMADRQAEYVDMVCTGMPEEEMHQAGFEERRSQQGLIVPNYFEPYYPGNVDVTYSWKGIPAAGRIFKGDSDQDRPNMLP